MRFKKIFWFITAVVGLYLPLLIIICEVGSHSFGDSFDFNLSLKVTRTEGYIGIPGQIHLYSAKLVNLGHSPVKIKGCRTPSDTTKEEIDYPMAIQKFDNASNEWKTVREISSLDFCQSNDWLKETTTWIFPTQSIDFITEDAVGAIEGLKKDDSARLVAFIETGDKAWENAVYSDPFTIEDDVSH